jgi:hypothetical protein
MDADVAILEYKQIAPLSADVLRSCLLRRLNGVAWHDVDGDDQFGGLLESLELQFEGVSVFLRTPHDECGGYRLSDREFASNQPSAELSATEHATITHADNREWLGLVGDTLVEVELLLDLKDTRFARYHGIRCRFEDHKLGRGGAKFGY